MCKERYIDPFTDFGFKRLFGTEESKEHLIDLLNSIIVDEDEIVDIKYENVEKLGKSPSDRGAIFDLYCTTDKKTHIIVEMQNAKQSFFLDRSIYYSSFLVQDAAEKGKWDFRLPKIYTIGFMNFCPKEFESDPNFKHVVRLADIETHKPVSDRLTFIYLEMKKFAKTAEELQSESDEWIYVIKNLPQFLEYPEHVKGRIFQSFFRLAEVSKMSKAEKMQYEESLKQMRDYVNCIDTAREEGVEEGALKERYENARKMKVKKLPLDLISEITGLSIEELQQL